jgi:hypothetical protein
MVFSFLGDLFFIPGPIIYLCCVISAGSGGGGESMLRRLAGGGSHRVGPSASRRRDSLASIPDLSMMIRRAQGGISAS